MKKRNNCIALLAFALFPYLIIAMLFINIRMMLACIIGFLALDSNYKSFRNEKDEGTIVALVICIFVTFIADLALGVNVWLSIIFTLIPSCWYYFIYTKIAKNS